VSRRYDFHGICFEVCVAKPNVQRSLLLLHTLVRAFRARGYTIGQEGERSKQPYIEVLDRRFKVSVWEPSRRQKRELSKQEKERKEQYPWSVRDYEHVASGLLEVHLDRGSYSSGGRIADTKKKLLEQRLNELIVLMLKTVDRERVQQEEERLRAAEREKRRRAAIEQEVIVRSDGVREGRLLKAVPQWENAQRIRRYIDEVREAIKRFGVIDESSEVGFWLRWAEQYLESTNPFSGHRNLPTYSLTPQELDQLRKECESDWCSWSETFRPRQPR
jgi:hypothetical protein